MRSLLVSLCLVFAGCRSAYESLVPVAGMPHCVEKFKPVFKSDLYTTQADVIGKHITGLMLFKAAADSSIRTVFMNEAGVTFFDFEFLPGGGFNVHHVIHALDKKPVLRTLRKDLELLMMLKAGKSTPRSYRRGEEVYYAFPDGKETSYVITDKDCTSLLRLEVGSGRKKKSEVRFSYGSYQKPDSIVVRHFNFNMTISMKKLIRE